MSTKVHAGGHIKVSGISEGTDCLTWIWRLLHLNHHSVSTELDGIPVSQNYGEVRSTSSMISDLPRLASHNIFVEPPLSVKLGFQGCMEKHANKAHLTL